MSIYVLTVRAMSERFVVGQLHEAKIPAFSPIVTRWEWREGRRLKAHRPMLPRYVFAHTDDLERDYAAMRHARRVSDVLSANGKPYALPAKAGQWIGTLALQQALGCFDHTAKAKPKLSIRQQVRIIAGQFKGYLAEVVECDETKVTVRVDGKFITGRIGLRVEEVEAVDVKEKAA